MQEKWGKPGQILWCDDYLPCQGTVFAPNGDRYIIITSQNCPGLSDFLPPFEQSGKAHLPVHANRYQPLGYCLTPSQVVSLNFNYLCEWSLSIALAGKCVLPGCSNCSRNGARCLHHIMKSIRPSQFFSHVLNNMGKPGYTATGQSALNIYRLRQFHWVNCSGYGYLPMHTSKFPTVSNVGSGLACYLASIVLCWITMISQKRVVVGKWPSTRFNFQFLCSVLLHASYLFVVLCVCVCVCVCVSFTVKRVWLNV